MKLELPDPEEGLEIEMWFRDMDISKPGVRGIFNGGVYRSHDLADRYEKHEVRIWRYPKAQLEYTLAERVLHRMKL